MSFAHAWARLEDKLVFEDLTTIEYAYNRGDVLVGRIGSTHVGQRCRITGFGRGTIVLRNTDGVTAEFDKPYVHKHWRKA